MFGLFKRKKTCKHYKKAGELVPLNMIDVVRFSPYEKPHSGYGIMECTGCGKRAFSCSGHCMSQKQCDIIDAFITHEIELSEFEVFLIKEMAWYEITEKSEEL